MTAKSTDPRPILPSRCHCPQTDPWSRQLDPQGHSQPGQGKKDFLRVHQHLADLK
jgi:hypothetical protein